jgi:hypothetical protein
MPLAKVQQHQGADRKRSLKIEQLATGCWLLAFSQTKALTP